MTAKSSKHPKLIKHKKLIIVLSAILAFIIILCSSYFIVIKVGENALRKKLSGIQPTLPVIENELPEDADAYYDGAAYNYNANLINILLIGVDKKNITSGTKNQADALYLVSLDSESKVVNMIGISRNTIAKIDVYDISGDFFGTANSQICLSYAYGSDDSNSSGLTVKAVSELFFGLPISGYYTVFMDSIESIVDSVGGVPVHIVDDMTAVSPGMTAGANVLVDGSEALKYLRYREEINEPRFVRQKAFMSSFVSQAKKAVLKDLTLPVKMYNKLSKNTVTDVEASSAVYLASEAVNADFRLHSIPGTVGFDGTFETFEVDNDGFYKLILDVFYKKQ